MAHVARRRRPSHQKDVAPVFRAKRIHSCRNFVGTNTSKYQRSNLKTEVVMRKEKLTPEKLNNIKEATAKLSADDKALLTQVFFEGDIDSTGLLVRSELHQALISLGINCTNQEVDDLLAFADADKSKAIDMEEWLMLVGLLIQPPYDEDELLTSFELLFNKQPEGYIAVDDFATILNDVLSVSLSPAEISQISTFLTEIVQEFDPEGKGHIWVDDCIEKLLTPYSNNE